MKRQRRGKLRLTLFRTKDGHYFTADVSGHDAEGNYFIDAEDVFEDVFDNGQILRSDTWDEIRARRLMDSLDCPPLVESLADPIEALNEYNSVRRG